MGYVPSQIDYEAVLADLEARRTAIEALIAGIRLLLGHSPVDAGTGLSNGSGARDLRSDTFFGLTTPEAVKKFLAMKGRAQGPRVIASALVQGGQPRATDEKAAYVNVYSALKRLNKSGEVAQTAAKEWGLAEWCGNRRPKPKNDKGENATEATNETSGSPDAGTKAQDATPRTDTKKTAGPTTGEVHRAETWHPFLAEALKAGKTMKQAASEWNARNASG